MRFILALGIGLLVGIHALARDYKAAASGRCVYLEGTELRPIPGATVYLHDNDFGLPPSLDVVGPIALETSGNDVCATGTTDADGRFHLEGDCHNSTQRDDTPTLYVRCALASTAGRVLEPSESHVLYNSISKPVPLHRGVLKMGDISLSGGAASLFVGLNRAHHKLRRFASVPKDVWAFYPAAETGLVPNSGQTYFASYAGAVFMTIASGDESNGTVAHEYGHTLQFQSFLHDWATIDKVLAILRKSWSTFGHSTGEGHSFSTLTGPVSAYSEAFADLIQSRVVRGTTPDCKTWQIVGKTMEEQLSVEGNLFCWLMSLKKRHGLRRILAAQQKSGAVTFLDLYEALESVK